MENGSFKNSSSLKNEITASHFEVDINDQYLQRQVKVLKLVDAARIGITTLALLCGIVILGLSGDAISVYNSTRMSDAAGWLSIWPASFDLRPTVALVVGSCIVTIANLAGLLCSKVPHVSRDTQDTPRSLLDRDADHDTAADPQQHSSPHPCDVQRALCRIPGLPHRHHRLLCCQCLDDDRYPHQLDVPLEVRLHGLGPVLWHAV